MAGPIDLKFSGAILCITGFLARGLLEMCMIPFKCCGVKKDPTLLNLTIVRLRMVFPHSGGGHLVLPSLEGNKWNNGHVICITQCKP